MTRLARMFLSRYVRPSKPAKRSAPSFKPGLISLEDRLVPSGRPLPLPVIYVGAETGSPPVVKAYAADTGALNFQRTVYEPTFSGGVRIANADFNRDGYPDLAVAPGSGGGPRVRILDGLTGNPIPGPLGDFYAYSPAFTGGVEVAAADVNGDGTPDLITAAGPGGGPHVQVFSGKTGKLISSFFAFESSFAGGARVAASDFTNDGKAEVVVAAGTGGGPRVRVLNGSTGTPISGPLGDFFAFDPADRGGAFVGTDARAGDVTGDGRADLVTGSGWGTAPTVRVYSGMTGATVSTFAPFDSATTAGVRVATTYASDDEFADVVVSTGVGAPGQVRVFDVASGTTIAGPLGAFDPFGPDFTGGIVLAASVDPPVMSEPFIDPEEPVEGEAVTFTVTFRFEHEDFPTGEVLFYAITPTGSRFELGTVGIENDNGNYFATATSSSLPVGSYTVYALSLKGDSSTSTELEVFPAPPVLTVPADMTATATVPILLPVTATGGGGIAAVEWWFSYDGEDYVQDPAVTTLSPTYTFPTYGEYDVWVVVTGNNGGVAEDGFHVTAKEVIPNASVTPTITINEGETASFTIADIDPDTRDDVTIYADWTGKNDFVQIDETDWGYDPAADAVVIAHSYDWEAPNSSGYAAVIRVEDEGGDWTDHEVTVIVNPVLPQATLTTDTQISSMESGNMNFWVVNDGGTLRLENVVLPSSYETQNVTYHWTLTDSQQTVTQYDKPEPDLSLPSYAPGTLYRVVGWVSDTDGYESPHQSFTAMSGYLIPHDGHPDYQSWTDGGSPYFGSVSLAEEGDPGPGATYATTTGYMHVDYPANTPFTVVAALNSATLAFAASRGDTITYRYTVSTYDVEQFTWGNNNDLLSTQTFTNSSGSLELSGIPMDRAVDARVDVMFYRNGVLDGDMVGIHLSVLGSVGIRTPLTPTTFQQVSHLLDGIEQLCQLFGDSASAVWNAVKNDAGTFFGTLSTALSGALNQFVTNLPGTLQTKMFEWLLGSNGSSVANMLNGLNWSDSNAVTAVFLNYANLTWDHVYQVVRQRLGDGNLMALQTVANWFQGLDPNDPQQIVTFLQQAGLNPETLKTLIKTKISNAIETGLAKAGAQLAAKFVPGAGVVTSLYNALTWVLDNQQQLAGVMQKFLDNLDNLKNGNAAAAQAGFYDIFQNLVTPVMNFATSQLGIGGLPAAIRKAVSFVPNKVDEALRTAIDSLATVALGGAQGGQKDGKVAGAVTVNYDGKSYSLWAAKDASSNQVQVKIALGGKLVTTLLPKDFDPAVQGNITALIAAAKALVSAVKPGQNPASVGVMANLRTLQDAVTAAENAVKNDIENEACNALNGGCFAAGTKLWTPGGYRNVEAFRVGDSVYSRNESDPAGPVEAKVVEKIFERYTGIVHFHVNGQVIRTTHEHPFYVHERGWQKACEIKSGVWILTAEGKWVPVEEVYDTGEWEVVYNLRVGDHHTYFVGDEHWGWAAWAHNTYDFISGRKVAETVAGMTTISQSIKDTILAAVLAEGAKGADPTLRFGAVGDVNRLAKKIKATVLGSPNNQATNVTLAIEKYFLRPCVKEDKVAREKAVRNQNNWTTYIQTNLGDNDARGKSKAGYEAEMRAENRNPNTHGHHIVPKKGTNGGGATGEARDARDILLYYGINPYWHKENLAYAPNGGHNTNMITYMDTQLKLMYNAIPRASREAIIANLVEFADSFIRGTLG